MAGFRRFCIPWVLRGQTGTLLGGAAYAVPVATRKLREVSAAMAYDSDGSAALFEHRFWLQILGDHARFIDHSLAPEETAEIRRAQAFIRIFDELLDKARAGLADGELDPFSRLVHQRVMELRNFKLHLLKRHLTGRVGTSLPATFYNHMLNELDECVKIVTALAGGRQPPVFEALHHHLLWLDDAVGHCGSIEESVDPVEKRLREIGKNFEEQFLDFYYQAVQLAGFVRANVHEFPALSRFNKQVELEMLLFMEFLKELKEMGLKAEELGSLTPLMADHMAREECYYLTKLSQVSEVRPPRCDPAHPRVEP